MVWIAFTVRQIYNRNAASETGMSSQTFKAASCHGMWPDHSTILCNRYLFRQRLDNSIFQTVFSIRSWLPYRKANHFQRILFICMFITKNLSSFKVVASFFANDPMFTTHKPTVLPPIHSVSLSQTISPDQHSSLHRNPKACNLIWNLCSDQRIELLRRKK